MQTVTLTNGTAMPRVGCGTNTYGKENHDYQAPINMDTTELRQAIEIGYRHFDTAIMYRNEAVIGKAIQESGLSRDEFFITSKIPGEPEYYETPEATARGIEQSLERLGVDTIDLYLIHHPWDNPEEMLAMWRVLEDYVAQGKLKEIGVSNFDANQLQHLVDHAKIKPACNQIQSNGSEWNHDLVAKCHELDVVPVAWKPVGRFSDASIEQLSAIGERYNKSWAQVVLRYQLQRGVVVIPKSHQREHQAENFDLWNFELTTDECKQISQLS